MEFMRRVRQAGALCLVIFSLAFPAQAQPDGLGIGVVVGEPTGISGKVWVGRTQAFDATAAWSLKKGGYLLVQSSILFHRDDLEGLQRGRHFFYFGMGGRIVLASDPVIGIRVPVGVTALFRDAPMDAFFELVPVFDLVPSTRLGLNGGIGIRYYIGGSGASRRR